MLDQPACTMSNIRSLRKAFPGTAWKMSFADSLLQLDPSMNPDAADEASDEAFVRLEHLAAPEAAAAWVEQRSGDVVEAASLTLPSADDADRRSAVI